ncbi:MAG: TonB-dependent receptor [Alphaproteobacteria bacterium]|nr:TonB-dependent receptor [Alphaproteobacteria bacterium]MBU1512712.1 TonB-dependent receptor [Alphaproteobacteria bacterium]MBU2096091.1 TonB-dependent receptor [Alphaproteobacteria bacterium]MBU2152447.1 TonB-dependent receptor [Alphaproteobacteria bacterium]MBU2308019.1 TonB-dependent receptor [Alphaproteobacteria bacterium]
MSLMTRALSRALLLGACAWPVLAFADEADTPNTVDRVVVTGGRSALTVPDTAQATADIQRTAGGVALIPDTAFKSGPAAAIKDILAYVPGIITQPRYGPDARVSIRGSGLSRAYGNRGIQALVDGVPINTSDGLLDLSEVDPSAYRYVEVFKGANALRYGGNSLGGAINFVTPTGRDATGFDGRLDGGSFGFVRGQASTGGADGAWDWVVNASAQSEDGYRDHSKGTFKRLNANLGYRLSSNVETRFYVNAYAWRARIPGEVSKAAALTNPKAANSDWVVQDQQRNIDSVRLTNKTTVRLGTTTVEIGAYYLDRHVDHPIFQYLDFTVDDYGGFLRATDDRQLGALRNHFVAGLNLNNGKLDTEQFVNNPGAVKGALVASMVDKSKNVTAYAENALYVRPDLSLIAGVQYLHATRDRRDRFLSNGDQSGERNYDLWSPKVGVLWDPGPDWQVFANISRSAEVPSYDTISFATAASTAALKAQTATTFEAGTRGRRGELTWDASIYRAEIKNELQCLTTGPFSACSTINAGRTVHQGMEAGLATPLAKSAFTEGDEIELNLAYTLNDFKFDDDPRYGDNELPGVPKHLLRAEALYRHPSGLYAGPNVEWSPQSYYADNANTLTIDRYALLGFRVGFEAEAGWSAYLEGRNLTDKRYISTVAIAGAATPTSELFNPGMGRSVYGGLRYRW